MNFDFFTAIFFPRVCVPCGKSIPEGALCASCRGTIMIARALFCGKCGGKLPGGQLSNMRNACHPEFPYILGGSGNYKNEVLKNLIHSLKFRGVRTAAEPLAFIMAEYFLNLPECQRDLRNFIVMPIPLSRERRRMRGFNQSELIARSFAEHVGLPLETKCLVRAKHTKPQSETKSVAERRENIRGVFAVMNPTAVAGKNILLIDDVVTTGATFLEAARALKSAGAESVIALAAARA